MNTTKLINSIKAEENNIELLIGYKAGIHLKENHPLDLDLKISNSYPSNSNIHI